MIRFSRLAVLVIACGLAKLTTSEQINAECPAYFENLADESQVIDRLKSDL